ncbi:dihydrofolate reductase [Paenibacillus sp. F411]|uniref:dihydrofolate reductase family protein n=1 Tax=Paenibacillus sp. F411 TaxID=2820239 RepID=UPI001AAE9E0F|nr:dihydrofolate reductase family protein [Paenibacillus sp. F411]MBO2943449.1 dihydrofolate reductase [Paenibacillus sp. F411]
MKADRKVSVFIAPTLDGYIAGKDDSLDWLFKVEGEGDNGYSEFYDTVDTILMGKRTFDWIMNQGEAFPYKGKACYVFTRSETASHEDVTFVNGSPSELIQKLKKEDGSKIWVVGGGDLLQSLLSERLVDELFITIAPVLLGEGIPLFKGGGPPQELLFKGSRSFNQFVELHYEVKSSLGR